jgi:hypothetical protein
MSRESSPVPENPVGSPPTFDRYLCAWMARGLAEAPTTVVRERSRWREQRDGDYRGNPHRRSLRRLGAVRSRRWAGVTVPRFASPSRSRRDAFEPS